MSHLRYLLIGTASLTVALAGYLWLTLLSPYTYEAPEHLAPIERGEHQVFVYGTLRYAPVRWLAYGRVGDPVPATLEGYRRNALDLAAASGESVQGLLLRVDAEELARLDRYERRGLRYKRVCMTLASGQRAWVYRRL